MKAEGIFFIVVFVICILIVIIGYIWLELIEKPRERKQNEDDFNKIKEDEELLYSGENLTSDIDYLSICIPPCRKCGLINFRIWDIQPSLITVRCEHCKKKYDYRDSNLEIGFVQKLIKHHNLFCKIFENPNPLLDKYKNVPFDFSSLRSNQPIYQAYTFLALGSEILAKEENEDSNLGNRRIPRDVQDRVWRRDEGKCVICGSNEKLEFDHIIPFSKGGSNTYRNIQLLCESCNREKSNRIG